MKKSHLLRQRAQFKQRKYQGILDKAKAEKRDLTAEEEQELDDLQTEMDELENKIEALDEKEKDNDDEDRGDGEDDEDDEDDEDGSQRAPKFKGRGRQRPGGEQREVEKL